ncbi:MAG TPA: flagellar brake protein [bacterium]|nr:flagellar brake protein [bacterium]
MSANTSEKDLFGSETKVNPQFAVGLPIFFEMTLKNKRLRAQAELVGWVRPKILITSIPLDSRLVIVQRGTEMIVRYLFEGQVFGFHTRLLHKQNEPMTLWTLEYPELVEVKNLRRSPRIPLLLEVRNHRGERWYTVDISAHGLCVTVDKEPRMGDPVLLSFNLPDGNRIENLEGSVVRINSTTEEKQVGINFTEDDPEQLSLLRTFLENIQKRKYT